MKNFSKRDPRKAELYCAHVSDVYYTIRKPPADEGQRWFTDSTVDMETALKCHYVMQWLTYRVMLSILLTGIGLVGSIDNKFLDAALGKDGGVSRIDTKSIM